MKIDFVHISLIIVILLIFCGSKQEGFHGDINNFNGDWSPWSRMPPKRWEPRQYNYWKPWWFFTNKFHPANPSITNYNSNTYVLPQHRHTTIPVEETQLQLLPKDLAQKEKGLLNIKLDNTMIIILIILVTAFLLIHNRL